MSVILYFRCSIALRLTRRVGAWGSYTSLWGSLETGLWDSLSSGGWLDLSSSAWYDLKSTGDWQLVNSVTWVDTTSAQ